MTNYQPTLARSHPAAPLKGANHNRIVIEPKNLAMREHAALVELLMPNHFEQIWVTRSTRRDVISPEAAATSIELLRSLAKQSQDMLDRDNDRRQTRHSYLLDKQVLKREFFNASWCDAAMIWFDDALAVSTGKDGGVHIKLVESVDAQYACADYISNAVFDGQKPQATFELKPGTHNIAGDSGPAFTFSYAPSHPAPVDAGSAKASQTCKVFVVSSTVYVVAGQGELTISAA